VDTPTTIATPQAIDMQVIETIERILSEHVGIKYAYDDIVSQAVFDRQRQHFLVKVYGWQGDLRVNQILIDIEIKDGLLWVHYDGTSDDIVGQLEAAGISKAQIVLAWIPASQRPYTGYAIG
jgi:XisI protein